MAKSERALFSLEFWHEQTEKDLPNAERQPLQPVMIEDGKIKLAELKDTLGRHFSPGTMLGLRRRDGHICLEEVPNGITIQDGDDSLHEFELSQEILSMWPEGASNRGMLAEADDGVELLPIRVEEHPPDVLGPRLIDEVQGSPDGVHTGMIVRHLVRGFDYEELTTARVQELADVVCSEPFQFDPIPQLVAGEDWIGWQTRNRVIHQPADDDGALRESLASEILAGQCGNGSWDSSVVKTAYAMLRARSVDVPPDDQRLRRAAEWLLAWPQPEGRPGWWMLNEEYLRKWQAKRAGEEMDGDLMNSDFTEDDHDLFRGQEQQQVIPTCSRHHAAPCDSLHHPSATAAEALCRCGYADHPRLKDYANTMLSLHGMFGYFCACWGILDCDQDLEAVRAKGPDFGHSADQYEIALKSIPYGYARDNADLHAPARRPWYPGVHRPDLSDTNWQPPYIWQEVGVKNHFVLVGSYWQNADCWAKANRALSQFPEWSGSRAEFFALFQCHLYQTPMGEWHQAFPGGILRWIAEVTRTTRARRSIEESPALRFAEVMLLKSVPWLKARQKDDCLWHHEELPRWNDKNRPLSPRLGTYHIVSTLNEFGLLDRLRPSV